MLFPDKRISVYLGVSECLWLQSWDTDKLEPIAGISVEGARLYQQCFSQFPCRDIADEPVVARCWESISRPGRLRIQVPGTEAVVPRLAVDSKMTFFSTWFNQNIWGWSQRKLNNWNFQPVMISLDIAGENGWNLWCDELGFPEPFPPRQSPCSHTCKAYTGPGMGNIGATHVISYLVTFFSV